MGNFLLGCKKSLWKDALREVSSLQHPDFIFLGWSECCFYSTAFWGTRLWKTHYSKSETSHRERTSSFACTSSNKRFSTVEKMCVHVVMGWGGWTWRRWNKYVNKRLVAIELSFANVPLCTENHRIVSSFPLSVHESPRIKSSRKASDCPIGIYIRVFLPLLQWHGHMHTHIYTWCSKEGKNKTPKLQTFETA